jgi:hypothetical protein
MMPAWVIAGVVIVGICETFTAAAAGSIALAQAEVQHFHRAVGTHFDIGWLEVAVDDARLVGGVERVGDLPGECQRLIERDRARRDAVRERVALDQFHHDRALFEPVDLGNVRVVERRQRLGFPLEARQTIEVGGERIR